MATTAPTHIKVNGHLYRRANYSHLSQELHSTASRIEQVAKLLHDFVQAADREGAEAAMTKGGTAGGSVHGRIQRMQSALDGAAKVITDQTATIRDNVDVETLPTNMVQILNDLQRLGGYVGRDLKERHTVDPGYQWPRDEDTTE